MLSVFRNMFRIRDLRNKILFTLFIFAVYRLGAAVPVPGVDLDRAKRNPRIGHEWALGEGVRRRPNVESKPGAGER